MFLKDNILHITPKDLDDANAERETYKQQIKRGRVVIIERGVYNFETFTENIRSKVRAHHGVDTDQELKDLIGASQVEETLRGLLITNEEDNQFVNTHKLPSGRFLPAKKREELIQQSRILYLGHQLAAMTKGDALRLTKAKTMPELWDTLRKMCIKDGVKLPKNQRSFYRAIEAYGKAVDEGKVGICSRVSGKIDNQNTRKVKTKEQVALLIELRGHFNNYNFEQIKKAYNEVAEKLNWPTLSRQTVANFFELGENDDVTLAGRRGTSSWANQASAHVRRSKPTAAMFMVSVDGWDCELVYQGVKYKDGKKRTVYHSRLVLVVILDPHCNYPVGYSIGHQETGALLKAAMKNAVEHTKQLTGRYILPWQVQSDNFAKKEMGAFYDKVAHYNTPAKVGNAKAKPVEHYFDHLNRTYCQAQENWSGHNLDARKENQPNKEAKNMIKKNFPDENGVRWQIESFMRQEQRNKQADWLDSLNGLNPDDIREIDRMQFLEIFGTVREFTNRLTGEGLSPTIDGEKRFYELLDPEFRKLRHIDWTVVYDPNDLSDVLATSEKGDYRFVVPEKPTVEMALKDRTDEGTEYLKEIQQYNKQQKEEITEKRTENRTIIDEMVDNGAIADETAVKLMLSYGGQQKNTLHEAKKGLTQGVRPDVSPRKKTKPKPRDYEDDAISDF